MAKQNARVKTQPGSTEELSGTQTQEITIVNQPITVGQLNRGNATISRWLSAVKAAERLQNPQRRQLIELIQDVAIDPYVQSLLEKRTGAIQLSPFVWHELENEAIVENMQSPWFFDFLSQTLDAKYRGHQLIQLNIGKEGLITDTEPIPRQNVTPEKKLITYMAYGEHGFRYDEPPYSDYIMEVGKPKEFGILSRLIPYVLMVRDNLAFMMTHNEMFGMPLRTYYYNPNDPSSRDQVTRQAEAQGAAAYIVLPESSRVEFQEANSASSGNNPYNLMHRLMREEISISILGQTLTTNTEGKGSNALGRIHKDVEEAINLQDMLFLELHLNYKFKRLAMRHGYPLEGIKGSFQKTERLSQTEKVNIWTRAANHTPIDPEAWQEEFGLPAPENQEHIEVWTKKQSGATQLGAEGGPGTDIKTELDSYGVAVRAGAITPQIEDEQYFRNRLSLPDQNEENKRVWGEDGGTRRPVTLKPQEVVEGEIEKSQKKSSKSDPKSDPELSAGAKKKAWTRQLTQLYGQIPTQLLKYTQLNFEDDLRKAWDRVVTAIHNQELQAGDVDQQLFEIIGTRLSKGISEGFGKIGTELDEAMIAALQENVFVFSGFKTYQELREVADLLLDADGKVKAFNVFRQEVQGIFEQYNVNWLLTEYNMAIANSQAASKWLEFEKDKEDLPWLRYRSVRDTQARHLQYQDITRRVDDPIWNYLTPPLDWGCRCTLQQVAEGEPTEAGKIPGQGEVGDLFAFNPGKQRIAFPKNHPYFSVAAADAQRAGSLFDLKIPDGDGS